MNETYRLLSKRATRNSVKKSQKLDYCKDLLWLYNKRKENPEQAPVIEAHWKHDGVISNDLLFELYHQTSEFTTEALGVFSKFESYVFTGNCFPSTISGDYWSFVVNQAWALDSRQKSRDLYLLTPTNDDRYTGFIEQQLQQQQQQLLLLKQQQKQQQQQHSAVSSIDSIIEDMTVFKFDQELLCVAEEKEPNPATTTTTTTTTPSSCVATTTTTSVDDKSNCENSKEANTMEIPDSQITLINDDGRAETARFPRLEHYKFAKDLQMLLVETRRAMETEWRTHSPWPTTFRVKTDCELLLQLISAYGAWTSGCINALEMVAMPNQNHQAVLPWIDMKPSQEQMEKLKKSVKDFLLCWLQMKLITHESVKFGETTIFNYSRQVVKLDDLNSLHKGVLRLSKRETKTRLSDDKQSWMLKYFFLSMIDQTVVPRTKNTNPNMWDRGASYVPFLMAAQYYDCYSNYLVAYCMLLTAVARGFDIDPVVAYYKKYSPVLRETKIISPEELEKSIEKILE
jgi:hypothetical protein